MWPCACLVNGMILLIWSSERATECALAIEHALHESVQVAGSLHEGCERLRMGEASVVVMDQWLTEADPEATSVLFEHLGMAMPLFVNFGISGQERVLRELRTALSRRGLETVLARVGAKQALHDELKDDVTALLLSCGMAIADAAVSEPLRSRLKTIEEVAEQIRGHLRVSGNGKVQTRV